MQQLGQLTCIEGSVSNFSGLGRHFERWHGGLVSLGRADPASTQAASRNCQACHSIQGRSIPIHLCLCQLRKLSSDPPAGKLPSWASGLCPKMPASPKYVISAIYCQLGVSSLVHHDLQAADSVTIPQPKPACHQLIELAKEM